MERYSQGLLTYALLKSIKHPTDILEQGNFFDVARWFSAAEKKVAELTKENGVRQQPQIVNNNNFNIGLVDDEETAGITLPEKKPLFSNCNLHNADETISNDDKEFNKLLDQKLVALANQGVKSFIVYIPKHRSEGV